MVKGKGSTKLREIPIEVSNILEHPMLWDNIVIDELNKKIVGEIEAREIILLCAMGSLVENCAYTSFNLLMHSESSAGKDYVTKSVLKIMPSSVVFSRTRISPTVLNYWKPFKARGKDGWDGSILYLPDVSEPVLNSDAMKLLCSDGSHITITEKGEAKDIEIKGKPVLFTTTATSSPSEEILNRFSIVHLNESATQTKKIMLMQAERMEKGLSCEYNPQIKEALFYLKRREVKIPFATKIVDVFPCKKVSERRNFERFLDFIKAITCVHQYQREGDGQFLIAEIADYDKARDVFMNIQRGVSSIPLNQRQKDVVGVLMDATDMISLTEIHRKLKRYIALQNFRPHLESLVNIRVVDKHYCEDGFGREIIKYCLNEEYLNFKPIVLPNGHDLIKNNNKKDSNGSNVKYVSNSSNKSNKIS